MQLNSVGFKTLVIRINANPKTTMVRINTV